MIDTTSEVVPIPESHESGLSHCLLNNTEFVVKQTPTTTRAIEYRRLMYKRWYAIRKHVPYSNRIRACHTMLNPSKQALDVQVNGNKRVRIVGHVHCDNVWLCPLCSNKRAISHARKLNLLLQHAIDNNLSVYFVTFTLWHSPYNKLTDTYNALKNAMRKMKQSKAFGYMLDEYELEKTSVTFTEITYGQNGFHPHFHTLFFASDGYSGNFDDTGMNAVTRKYELKKWESDRSRHESKLQKEFFTHWHKALKQSAFSASEEKGVHVRLGDSAVKAVISYLNEEGVSVTKETDTGLLTPNRSAISEVTSYATKNPKMGGVNPFDLLPDNPDKFDEYMEGTKGKQRVSGLDDLLKKFGINDNATVTFDEDNQYVTLFELSIERYRMLIQEQRVSEFIEFVENSLVQSEK